MFRPLSATGSKHDIGFGRIREPIAEADSRGGTAH